MPSQPPRLARAGTQGGVPESDRACRCPSFPSSASSSPSPLRPLARARIVTDGSFCLRLSVRGGGRICPLVPAPTGSNRCFFTSGLSQGLSNRRLREPFLATTLPTLPPRLCSSSFPSPSPACVRACFLAARISRCQQSVHLLSHYIVKTKKRLLSHQSWENKASEQRWSHRSISLPW